MAAIFRFFMFYHQTGVCPCGKTLQILEIAEIYFHTSVTHAPDPDTLPDTANREEKVW
jgi:hypothetical protein